MPLRISERLIDPKSPERRPRRAAYALPTFFTAANVFFGFLAITKTVEGTLRAQQSGVAHIPEFALAAQLIGVAVACDGLDGRMARMTNTVSDFGRELDSLADVITFGIAPAVLAFCWGFFFIEPTLESPLREQILQGGYFLCFVYLLCGAARLARFNVVTNPIPKNPGRPDRKYFVGLPIPAAAAFVASIVYASDSVPIENWMVALCWLALLGLVSFLMVSTWRYRSFKDLNLLQPRSPLSLIVLGSLIFLVWYYSQPVLFALCLTYTASGILVRIGGLLRRRPTEVPPVSENPSIG
ncbi:CDP-diacylglycerol--serine O-phosphatidyltransferase [Bryobacter aggregatus]|uniref:CDP-diacylglycerol--serine O-phosphatidyltransferase n=1 Tax=Bryobacter aggregatus TaxID=360054 RepID=UPI0005617CA4|nr:CDP-diacylglycerol--serine O-phosphatidyltransferase [Bryobacter aggregatus]